MLHAGTRGRLVLWPCGCCWWCWAASPAPWTTSWLWAQTLVQPETTTTLVIFIYYIFISLLASYNCLSSFCLFLSSFILLLFMTCSVGFLWWLEKCCCELPDFCFNDPTQLLCKKNIHKRRTEFKKKNKKCVKSSWICWFINSSSPRGCRRCQRAGCSHTWREQRLSCSEPGWSCPERPDCPWRQH